MDPKLKNEVVRRLLADIRKSGRAEAICVLMDACHEEMDAAPQKGLATFALRVAERIEALPTDRDALDNMRDHSRRGRRYLANLRVVPGGHDDAA